MPRPKGKRPPKRTRSFRFGTDVEDILKAVSEATGLTENSIVETCILEVGREVADQNSVIRSEARRKEVLQNLLASLNALRDAQGSKTGRGKASS